MRYVLLIFLCFTAVFSYGQDSTATKLPEMVKGTITSSTTQGPLSDVNIVNINQVVGVATDPNGEFEIKRAMTIYNRNNPTTHNLFVSEVTLVAHFTFRVMAYGTQQVLPLRLMLEQVVDLVI